MRDAARLHSDGFLAAAALVGAAGAASWLAGGAAGLGTAGVLVLAALTLLLGLPHGALDLWLAGKQSRWAEGGRLGLRGGLRFHAEYLGLAALTVLAFALLPTLSLIAFLALSLWHFGDDWRAVRAPVRIACAGVVVLAPTLFHPAAVADIFAAMTGREALTAFVPMARPVIGGLLGAALAAAFVSDERTGLEAAALTGLAVVLPPLAFFAAYFVLLHAPRHMLRHREALGGGRGRLLLAGYTLAALGLLVGLGYLSARLGGLALTDATLRAVFVGLAALTVPHAILVEADKRRGQGAARGVGQAGRAG